MPRGGIGRMLFRRERLIKQIQDRTEQLAELTYELNEINEVLRTKYPESLGRHKHANFKRHSGRKDDNSWWSGPIKTVSNVQATSFDTADAWDRAIKQARWGQIDYEFYAKHHKEIRRLADGTARLRSSTGHGRGD